jgi:hypothetical protein
MFFGILHPHWLLISLRCEVEKLLFSAVEENEENGHLEDCVTITLRWI